ncbi:MAG: hypothetical protein ACI8S6_001499 [Myxococcota bacterium]|jgi:hypothetical protein
MWMVLLGGLAAAASLELNIEGPARYHGEALIQSGTPVQLLASNNINARVVMIGVAIDYTCVGRTSDRGWAMDCEMDNVGLQGAAFSPQEQEGVDAIMTEYAGFMEEASVQIELNPDGRVRLVDIEGIDKRDERMRNVHEYIRLIVRRTFAPLDIQMPRKSEADVDDKWKRKSGGLTFELFSRFGTVGGSLIKYVLTEATAEQLTVTHEGRGNIGVSSAGATLTMEDGATDSTTSALYNTLSSGYGYFDPSSHRWLYAEYQTQGTLNQAATSGVNQFTQAAWIGRINDDGTVEGPEGPRRLDAE